MKERDEARGARRAARAIRGRLTYANVMATIAVFGVLGGGGAYAASKIGPKDIKKNAVRSKHIKNGQVKGADTERSQVQARVGGSCAPGLSIRAIAENGTVTCETVGGGGPPTGPAGGDLAGSYPNPIIANSAVNSAKVADNSLTGADILNGGVGAADLAANSVNAAKVADESLSGLDIADETLTGADIVESTLAFGQAQLTFADQATTIGEGTLPKTSEIVTPALPAGAYSVTAVVNYGLSHETDLPQMRCRLANSTATGGFDEHRAFLNETARPVFTVQSMALTLTNSIPAGGRFVLRCTHVQGDPTPLLNRKIMAVRQVSQSQAMVTPSDSG